MIQVLIIYVYILIYAIFYICQYILRTNIKNGFLRSRLLYKSVLLLIYVKYFESMANKYSSNNTLEQFHFNNGSIF